MPRDAAEDTPGQAVEEEEDPNIVYDTQLQPRMVPPSAQPIPQPQRKATQPIINTYNTDEHIIQHAQTNQDFWGGQIAQGAAWRWFEDLAVFISGTTTSSSSQKDSKEKLIEETAKGYEFQAHELDKKGI